MRLKELNIGIKILKQKAISKKGKQTVGQATELHPIGFSRHGAMTKMMR